ncbi:hypothetical protein GCM10023188_22740 [Pontibacter saemangeumensis]|uniref:PKD-like family protein n=1 Tax=Pontibacter saemangeumensis TaxID=1084525 RepID=A0ABP8LQP0_9BACT
MKTANHLFYSISVSALVLLNSGCLKHDKDIPEPEISVISEENTGVAPTIVGNIPETYHPMDYAEEQERFDWENLAYLPFPPGNELVPMPWSDQAKRQFSDDIRYDYRKSDGWELYQSTFSSKFKEAHIAFSLYNKYRGILRYYYYVGSGTEKYRDYKILQNCVVSSEGSPLLNFTSQYIIDINQNTAYSYSFEPQDFAGSAWYAVEYELAFDKNIYSKGADFQMGSFFSMKKKNSLSINGKEQDELNAKVRAFGIDKSAENITSADACYIVYGDRDFNQIASTDINYFDRLDDKHILSGVLSKPAAMHIKWGAKLDLQLPPNGIGVSDESFFVSGSNLSRIQGKAPYYEKALGVFYLDRKPLYAVSENTEKSHPYEYTLDVSSVEYLFNPSLLEIADVNNLKQELVATEQESLMQNNNLANLYTGQVLKSTKPLYIQGVRVSFDVVPKDGGGKVHMIKTFRADLKS